jgi:RNA polymerase sigma-70 factor (ECF subfamily)
LDYFKKKKEILASEFRNDEGEDYNPFNEKGYWIKDMRPQEWGTDEFVNQAEFQSILNECLHHLSKQHQEVFAMKYIENLETEEICKELSISSSNYWVLVHRAKLKLRKCLEINWLN